MNRRQLLQAAGIAPVAGIAAHQGEAQAAPAVEVSRVDDNALDVDSLQGVAEAMTFLHAAMWTQDAPLLERIVAAEKLASIGLSVADMPLISRYGLSYKAAS